jgi:SAM-dependent methyltransferase
MIAVIGRRGLVANPRTMPISAALAPWTSAETVAGFARSSPNDVLIRYAAGLRAAGATMAVDIGCGAGRNAIPLAQQGWDVLGTDLSWPMLEAARDRANRESPSRRVWFSHAPMEALPAGDETADLLVAHGIWNLAESSAQFRAAVREAARVARTGAGLFVFTFSRNTLPAGAAPVSGETFVFTQFAGRPQVFLTEVDLIQEMRAAGFEHDAAVSVTEYNRRAPGALAAGTGPVIYEAGFRRVR